MRAGVRDARRSVLLREATEALREIHQLLGALRRPQRDPRQTAGLEGRR